MMAPFYYIIYYNPILLDKQPPVNPAAIFYGTETMKPRSIRI